CRGTDRNKPSRRCPSPSKRSPCPCSPAVHKPGAAAVARLLLTQAPLARLPHQCRAAAVSLNERARRLPAPPRRLEQSRPEYKILTTSLPRLDDRRGSASSLQEPGVSLRFLKNLLQISQTAHEDCESVNHHQDDPEQQIKCAGDNSRNRKGLARVLRGLV